MVLPYIQECRLDTLILHHLAVAELEPETVAPELERRLQLGYRNANVIDPVEHAASVYGRPLPQWAIWAGPPGHLRASGHQPPPDRSPPSGPRDQVAR
jgi:hypothetical protein